MSSSKNSNVKKKQYKKIITNIEYKTKKNQLINPKIIRANQLVVVSPLILVFLVKSIKHFEINAILFLPFYKYFLKLNFFTSLLMITHKLHQSQLKHQLIILRAV